MLRAERFGDEPRGLFASVSIAWFGAFLVRHSHSERHLVRTMNDSQHLDALRMDPVHEPILPYDELSNRRVIVLRNLATAFCENAERSRCGDELAHDAVAA